MFVARGTNVNGYNWVWNRSTTGDASLIDDCWNFNLIRVNSFLFNGQIPWPQYTANNNLDSIVRTFTNRGVVVMFEAHDRIGSYYSGSDLDTLVRWFTDLATRYRNNPYVWFNIANEPGGRSGIDSTQWVGMHGRVIEAIRGTGANNIIVVDGAYGGQDTRSDSAILRYGQQLLSYNGHSYGNIVFSIHTYDLWNNGGLGSFIDQVRGQRLALLIGEYGVLTDQDVQRAARYVFSEAASRNVGLVVWHWDGHDYNDLTANTTWGGGWEINSCSNPTNLSWLGQQVWNVNH
ncbi:MAG: cellulase family glycosylhydrolase [Anaerolineae bacterium]